MNRPINNLAHMVGKRGWNRHAVYDAATGELVYPSLRAAKREIGTGWDTLKRRIAAGLPIGGRVLRSGPIPKRKPASPLGVSHG